MRLLALAALALTLAVGGCGAGRQAGEELTADTSATTTSSTTTTNTTTTVAPTTAAPATTTTTKAAGAACNPDAYREAWRRATGATAELIVSDDRCNGTWALVNVLQGPNRTSYLVGFHAKGDRWNQIDATKSGVGDLFVANLVEAGFPKSLLTKWGEALDGPGSAFADIPDPP
ncbi:MAG: hypothetical protein U0U69_06505 [Acidimicrobiia bacterium]